MPFNPEQHHRRSIRLQGWDYASNGAYFVTLVTHHRECLFCQIVAGVMQLNALGEIAADQWLRSAEIRSEIELDEWVIMPNHLHGIVVIATESSAPTVSQDNARLPSRAPLQLSTNPSRRPRSLGAFVAGYKSAVTTQINVYRETPKQPVWLRNYYERIIRNERELNAIRRYIADNPKRWANDRDNVDVMP